ncbi:MAG: 50S ribosomal protein L11 methyltransferase [Chloroflexota bacterium]
MEIALRVPADYADPIADVLADVGYQGAAIERDDIPPDAWDEGDMPPANHLLVRAYLPADDDLTNKRTQLENALARYPVEAPIYKSVAEQDWADAWKRYYHPIRIGKRIVVHPLWEPPTNTQPDDILIGLDPGQAFGTGTHATTQLCLTAIEATLPSGTSVLDLGTGSGILSIAAAHFGASHIAAIDIDPVAVEAARENIERNTADTPIDLHTGGLPEALTIGKQYDYVIVNILARIIMQMCENGLGDLVKPGGQAIFSGVIESQVEQLE